MKDDRIPYRSRYHHPTKPIGQRTHLHHPEAKNMTYSYEPYEPYIPETTGEVYDLLAAFIGDSPTFEDKFGDFPGQNIETEFHALNEGWKNVRKKLGEEDYALAVEITARMKEMFLADPEDKTGETHEGRKLVWQLEEIIFRSNDRARKPSNDNT